MKILIVDDNEAFRLLLSVVLHGHDVIVAGDGAEAVAQAERYQPDIVLMDVQMPEVDGFEALRRLKANGDTVGIPVILMSAAYVRQNDVAHGLALGATDYLAKPFPFETCELPKVLEGYVEKKKVRDRTRT